MKKYRVIVKATIIQAFEILAEDEEDAEEQAHQMFDPSNVEPAEKYSETIEATEEI